MNMSNKLASTQGGITAGEWLQSRNKKTMNKEKSHKKYSFLDDSSSDESFSANQFIKKDKEIEEKDTKKDLKSAIKSERPKTSRGLPEKKQASTSSFQANSALSRFSQLEKEILSRKNTSAVLISSSDMDLNISSDSEVKRNILDIKIKNDTDHEGEKQSGLKELHGRKPSNLKGSRLDEMHHKITERKSVSFASLSEASEASVSEVSLDDFLPEKYDESSLDEIASENPASGHLLSVEDLEPADEVVKNVDKPSLVNLQSIDELLASHYSDDFEEGSKSVGTFVESTSSSKKTQSSKSSRQIPEKQSKSQSHGDDYTDDFDSDTNTDDTLKHTESITEEVSEDIKTETASIVTESIGTQTASVKSNSNSQKFDSISSKVTSSKLSQKLPEKSSDKSSHLSSSAISSKSPHKPTHRKSLSSDYTSSSFYSSTLSSPSPPPLRHRTPPPRRRTPPHHDTTPSWETKKVQRVRNAETQTDSVQCTNPPLEEKLFSKYIFERSKPTITNEALKILTSYSPGVLAVHEILKQQLEFTRNFIVRSERMYKSVNESLVPDYQYASLEEAKEIINLQRKKRNLPPKYPNNNFS